MGSKYLTWLLIGITLLLIAGFSVSSLQNSAFKNFGLTLWQQNYFAQNMNPSTNANENIVAGILQNTSEAYNPRIMFALAEMEWEAQDPTVPSVNWAQYEIGAHELLKRAFTLHRLPISDQREDFRRNMQMMLLNMVNSIEPDISDALMFEALLIYQNDSSRAVEMIEQSVQKNNWLIPEIGLFLNHEFAMSMLSKGESQEALAGFERASYLGELAGLDPVKDLEFSRILGAAYRQQGLLHQQMGNSAKAKQAFENGIEADSNNYWNYLSLAFYVDPDSSQPEALFNNAIDVAPTIKWPYVKAAEYYFGLQNEAQMAFYCAKTPVQFRKDADWLRVCSGE